MSTHIARHFETLGEPLTRREGEILAWLAEGLSAPEIAQELGVAASSVRSHLKHLYGKLGVNGRRQAVLRAREWGLLPNPTPSLTALTQRSAAALPYPNHNLPPQLTSFFGRTAEIASIRERLAEWRLVTLTGSGGVGKTRLALRAAEELLGEFPDGVWFVALAPVSDPQQVSRLVAGALGVSASSMRPVLDALSETLRERRLLFVLDNCEHLLDACALLAERVLSACPNVHILATSREALGIPAEGVYSVPSLPFPDPEQLPKLQRLDDFTALRLFVERTRAVVPEFSATPENAPWLARICQRLDGIPLALELAAARMRLLDCRSLARRLDDTFQVLTGGSRTALPRHQTLRATIDWSYNLLSEPERLLLQRLSQFAGGCTLEAAEAVCSGEGLNAGEVLERMAALVNKSMVVAEHQPGKETRYSLLEMVRQYAREKLAQAGESERLSRRHWQFFVGLAEANQRQFLAKERPALIAQLLPDYDNLRLALQWSYSGQAGAEDGIRLTLALAPFWFVWIREPGFEWFQKGIAVCHDRAGISKGIAGGHDGADITPARRAWFLAWASANRWFTDESRPLAEESLALSRTLGPEHREVLCWSLWIMSISGCYMEVPPEHRAAAEALLDEQTAIIPLLGPGTILDPAIYQGYNLWLRTVLANYRGDYERARAFARDSIRVFEAGGAAAHRVGPVIALGDTALQLGEHDRARTHLLEAFELAGETIGIYPDVRHPDCLVLLSENELRRGEYAAAFNYCKQYLSYSDWLPWVERMEMASRILAKAGQFAECARIGGAAEALSEQYGRKISDRTAADSHWGDWRTRCGDLGLEALAPNWQDRADRLALEQIWNDGRKMTFEQAQAYVLNEVVI